MAEPKKKKAWIRLSEYHMPHMKGMELGKRYHIHVEVEPTELSTGESEYPEYSMGMNGKPAPQPMRGTFKVHSISEMPGSPKGKKGSGKSARYEEDEK